jgi:hypothetical protein
MGHTGFNVYSPHHDQRLAHIRGVLVAPEVFDNRCGARDFRQRDFRAHVVVSQGLAHGGGDVDKGLTPCSHLFAFVSGSKEVLKQVR